MPKKNFVIIVGMILIAIAVYLVFWPEPPSVQPEEKTFRGYRSHTPGEHLSLEEAAENLRYFGNMSSVCHATGNRNIQLAYSYLFNMTNRYIHSGKWSFKKVMDAIQAARESYQEIDTALACSEETDNFHGLDLDQDLHLMTLALNYQFYKDKVPACKKAENQLDTRVYERLASREHRKLYSGRYSPEQITGARAEARISPDLQKIHGC